MIKIPYIVDAAGTTITKARKVIIVDKHKHITLAKIADVIEDFQEVRYDDEVNILKTSIISIHRYLDDELDRYVVDIEYGTTRYSIICEDRTASNKLVDQLIEIAWNY